MLVQFLLRGQRAATVLNGTDELPDSFVFGLYVGHQVTLVVVELGTAFVRALEHLLLNSSAVFSVNFDVSLEVLLGTELALTNITLIQCRVLQLPVSHQVRPASEFRRAGITFVDSMRCPMMPQRLQVHESLIAVVTPMRILTRMPEGMLLQLQFSPEPFATFVTGPRFAQNMLQVVMPSHVLIRGEGFATGRVFASNGIGR